MARTTVEHVDTLIIGGGQAGLSVGQELRKRGIDFLIVDANERVGDAWRNRWDSLRLFTPAHMNGLPGMKFPGARNAFVGKDQMADFLEHYAETMDLPVRTGVRVERLTKSGETFTAVTSAGTIEARNVIVAMADFQKPKVPEFASELDSSIFQMHSSEYRNPSQLQDGPALVVGLGTSGADLAYELASTRKTIVAGKETGAIPFKLESWFGRHIGTRLVKFAMTRAITTSNPLGRKLRPKMIYKAAPLVRIRPQELRAAGVERVSRIASVENGKPVTEDGTVLDVKNVVWCTGYKKGFDWIDLPVFDEAEQPRQQHGVSEDVPGLYFLGLYFLHAVWSDTLPGLQRDVKYVAKQLAERSETVAA